MAKKSNKKRNIGIASLIVIASALISYGVIVNTGSDITPDIVQKGYNLSVKKMGSEIIFYGKNDTDFSKVNVTFSNGVLSVKGLNTTAKITIPRTTPSRITISPKLRIKEDTCIVIPEKIIIDSKTNDTTITQGDDCWRDALPYRKANTSYNNVETTSDSYIFNVEHFTSYTVNESGTMTLTACLKTINNTGDTCIINQPGFYGVNTWQINASRLDFNKSGLVLAYDFDVNHTGNNITYDLSDSGNDGNVNRAIWNATGYYGGDYMFSGSTTQIIHSGNDTDLNLTDAITVSAWVKFNSVIGSSHITIALKNPVNDAYLLWKSGDSGHQTLAFRIMNTSNDQTIYSTITPTTGIWYNVVGTYNRTAGADNFKIYVNGLLNNYTTMSGNIVGTTGNLTWAQYVTLGGRLNGQIDQVRVYNRSLSQQEIEEQYAGDVGKYNITTPNLGVLNIQSANVTVDFNGSTIYTPETDVDVYAIALISYAQTGRTANFTIKNLDAQYPNVVHTGVPGDPPTDGSNIITIHDVRGRDRLLTGYNISGIEMINSAGDIKGSSISSFYIRNSSGNGGTTGIIISPTDVYAEGYSNGTFRCAYNCTLIDGFNLDEASVVSSNTISSYFSNVSSSAITFIGSNVYAKNITANTTTFGNNQLVEELIINNPNPTTQCILASSNNLTIKNSTINCGKTGIALTSTNSSIINSTINSTSGYSCLSINSAANNTIITNNSFYDCGSDKYSVTDKYGFYIGNTTYSYGGNNFNISNPRVYPGNLASPITIDSNDKNVSTIATGSNNFTLCLADIPVAGVPFATLYIEQPMSGALTSCQAVANAYGGTLYLNVTDYLGYNTATSNYSVNTSVAGLTINNGANPAYLRFANETHFAQDVSGIDNAGTNINFTGNTFNPTSINLENIISEHGINNSYWLNNFYYKGLNDTGIGTSFCVLNEGNFYEESLIPIVGDCGQINITSNSTDKLTVYTTWQKGQSSNNNLIYNYEADGVYQGITSVNASVVVPINSKNVTFYAYDGNYNSTKITINIKTAFLQSLILIYQQGKIILRDGMILIH